MLIPKASILVVLTTFENKKKKKWKFMLLIIHFYFENQSCWITKFTKSNISFPELFKVQVKHTTNALPPKQKTCSRDQIFHNQSVSSVWMSNFTGKLLKIYLSFNYTLVWHLHCGFQVSYFWAIEQRILQVLLEIQPAQYLCFIVLWCK